MIKRSRHRICDPRDPDLEGRIRTVRSRPRAPQSMTRKKPAPGLDSRVESGMTIRRKVIPLWCPDSEARQQQ
jgi:hypothetical protein